METMSYDQYMQKRNSIESELSEVIKKLSAGKGAVDGPIAVTADPEYRQIKAKLDALDNKMFAAEPC